MTKLTCTAALAFAISASSLRAQYVAPAFPAPSLIDQTLGSADPSFAAWDIGVNARLREEDKDGAGFTHAGSNFDFSDRPQDETNNRYLLYRLMPRVGYTSDWVSVLVQARSSYSFGDNRYNPATAGNNLPEDNGPIQLHQAYVLIGNPKEFPVSLKVGRQELSYGDQRLVGAFLWNNDARTFDAIKLRWENSIFSADVFAARVVYNWADHFNRSLPQDNFSGAYLTFPHLSNHVLVEAYFLARNVSRSVVTDNWSGIAPPFRFPGPQDVYTPGIRLKSKPDANGPWDYTVELMDQFGDRTNVYPTTTVAAALAAPRLTHQAQAAVLQLGYTWKDAPWKPRLALIGSYGSGGNPASSKSETFQNLFPTNHLFYGYMDLSSLQNLDDVRLAYTVKPTAALSFALEAHQQYLNKTSDYWYNVAGAPRNTAGATLGSGKGYGLNPAYSHDLGQEVDFVGGWAFTRVTAIELGVSHYFRGGYVTQSLQAFGSKDASYLYVQFTLNL